MDLTPLSLSLRVALLATLITFCLGLLAARLVAGMHRGKGLVDGLFTLPLVLPPTVVGFFLLVLFGKNGFFGPVSFPDRRFGGFYMAGGCYRFHRGCVSADVQDGARRF